MLNHYGDINLWYEMFRDKCPNCGTCLTDKGPQYNLFPHFMGGCKDKPETN